MFSSSAILVMYWLRLSWVRFMFEFEAACGSPCNLHGSQSAQCWASWHSSLLILGEHGSTDHKWQVLNLKGHGSGTPVYLCLVCVMANWVNVSLGHACWYYKYSTSPFTMFHMFTMLCYTNTLFTWQKAFKIYIASYLSGLCDELTVRALKWL